MLVLVSNGKVEKGSQDLELTQRWSLRLVRSKGEM